MRGGNRQRPRAEVLTERPPRPPRDLTALEAKIWRELAAAVGRLGTYRQSDAMFFRLTVKTIAEAEGDAPMPPTARARVLQAAGSMLASFGLSPLARQRVKPVEDDRSAAQRIADAIKGVK